MVAKTTSFHQNKPIRACESGIAKELVGLEDDVIDFLFQQIDAEVGKYVALVVHYARFDWQGNAKAFTLWNEWQDWLHVFMYIYDPFVKHANMVAIGKTVM